MENDDSGEWPGNSYADDGADLGATGDDLSGSELTDPELGIEGVDGDDSVDDDGPEVSGEAFDTGGYDLDAEPAVSDVELTDDSSPEGLDDHGDVSDAMIGTDPDTDPLADDASWQSDPFPAALDLDQPPEPVDGMPWSDPALLGDPGSEPLPEPGAGFDDPPPVSDLYAYDGMGAPADSGAPAWSTLGGSEDPATSSLARFWAPGA
ncbi:MAG: hypothetical protein ACRDT6_22940 [Micromonosporaceae bacterium]